MSTAKKCDRCGIFYSRYNENNNTKEPNGFVTANIDINSKYYSGNVIDLCQSCMGDLEIWLGAYKTQ